MNRLDSRGFTLVELMIATTVLAAMLVLIATVSIQIGRLFYKGVSSSRTQEAARSITDQISRNIQYSSDNPEDKPNVICVGGSRYNYRVNTRVAKDRHALWVDDQISPCDALDLAVMNSDKPSPSGKELVPSGMLLTKLELNPNVEKTYWEVDVGVGLGDDELFLYANPADMNSEKIGCVSTNKGGQFCDVAQLKVGVYRWIQ